MSESTPSRPLQAHTIEDVDQIIPRDRGTFPIDNALGRYGDNLYWGSEKLNTPSPVIAVGKSANESVVDDDTLQDDDHLFLELEANSVYKGQLVLWCTVGNTSQGLKYNWTLPSGASGRQFHLNGANENAGTHVANLTSDVTKSSGATSFVVFVDFLVITTNAGTIRLRWACANLTGTVTLTVLAGSSLVMAKVA